MLSCSSPALYRSWPLSRCCHRSPGAVSGTTRPIRPPVPSENDAERHQPAEQEVLHRGRHDPYCLGPAVPQQRMRQIEERRPARGTGVHDLEDGLQVTVEVDHGARDTLELEWLVAFVPPPVRRAARKTDSFAGPGIDAATIDLGREDARRHPPFFVLEEVDVEGRPFPVRRERSLDFEPDATALRDAS